MSGGADPARRAALALLVCALLAPQMVSAQDPWATTDRQVARAWPAIVDRLDAVASWNADGARFQQGMTTAQWAEILRRDRGSRGTIVQRAVTATIFSNSGPGLPDGGSHALVRFRSSCTNLIDGAEEVILEVGPGCVWHVIGHVLL